MGNSEEIRENSASQKKEVPSSLQKICLVCGDKALGYNFNAISCESCKAFFRRNALVSKEFKCPFTNNCEITVVTRRFCQKCRLEKCLAKGMVKEFIMSEEDKAEKRKKIEENRVRKRMLRDPEDTVSSSKSVKQDKEVESYNGSLIHDSVIQYDTLSTTCSPSSMTMQSPISNNNTDSVLQSPTYQFPTNILPVNENNTNDVPYPSEDIQYTMKVYAVDEKSVINRGMFGQRGLEPYNLYDNEDSNVPEDSLKNNIPETTIRSILTNEEASAPQKQTAAANEQACSDTPPSTSSQVDVNKAKEILQDVETIEPNSMESILCEAIKLEFEAYTSINRSGSSRELNEVERAKLNELIVANKALNAPIDDDFSQLVFDPNATTGIHGEQREQPKHDPRLITIVNLTAVAIRRFIKMAKKINAFKNMCEDDQVALLKGGCIEMMVLRSTMTYDGQRNQWTIPHSHERFGSVRTDVLKLAKGNIYRTYDSFIKSFLPQWRSDEHIILIMSAILLFTQNRSKVVHKDVIKLEQNSYYYLLRRYLESIYPGCEAKSTFLKLIQKILELRKLAEDITGVYLDVNPLEPLLMEIFDLKHHAA